MTFKGSSNICYNTTLLTFAAIGVLVHAPTACIQNKFYIKIMRSIDDNYKFTANVRNKDPKTTKIHHFFV